MIDNNLKNFFKWISLVNHGRLLKNLLQNLKILLKKFKVLNEKRKISSKSLFENLAKFEKTIYPKNVYMTNLSVKLPSNGKKKIKSGARISSEDVNYDIKQ